MSVRDNRRARSAQRPLIKSVNIHITKVCNLHCRFCFAQFNDREGTLSLDRWKLLVARLRDSGTEKINFAGGEPTLFRGLGELIEVVHDLGITSSIVTNGARLEPLLHAHARALDWVGLSVDSGNEEVQRLLGRGDGTHVTRTIQLAGLAHSLGRRVKLNSVVTALNWHEDLTPLVTAIGPERWKAFQVLEVAGENDDTVRPLLITEEQFAAFVDRHRHLGEVLVPETNDAILESYVMIDPLGCFFSDSGQVHTYSAPILDVGVDEALSQIVYKPAKTVARGGIYDWRGASKSAQPTRAPFVVVEGLDGSGKTTIAKALAERLGGRALDTPGTVLRGVRGVVHEGLNHNQDARALFYMASVVAHGAVARAAADGGTPVVMDRYWLSTVGYGGARGASVDFSPLARSVAAPDLIVLLTIDEDERQRRLTARGSTAEDNETLDERFREFVLRTMRDDGQPSHLRVGLELDVTGKSVDDIVEGLAAVIARRLAPANDGLVTIGRARHK